MSILSEKSRGNGVRIDCDTRQAIRQMVKYINLQNLKKMA